MTDVFDPPRQILLEGTPHILENETIAWAVGKLGDACASKGIALTAESAGLTDTDIRLELKALDDYSRADARDLLPGTGALAGEGYSLYQHGGCVTVVATDARGFSYALTEMSDAIRAGDFDFRATLTRHDTPSVPVRSIARAYSSVDEDAPWFQDRAFWTEYLDELASQRFNRFHLAFGMQFNYGTIDRGLIDNYLAFAYPFLVDVPGYGVRVDGLTSVERERNLAALRYVARETRRRGMTFSLGLWTHAYAFGVETRHRYPIIGISDDIHTAYCAAALGYLLAAVPDINALTFRAHFEAGIPEATQAKFWEPLFETISRAGRPIEVDLHAKGVGPDLLAAAKRHEVQTVLSGKYWAEHLGLPYHQTSIRVQETARPVPPGETMSSLASYSRLFTRYGYADYLSEEADTGFFFRMWPGTQKLLLWGDPALAAGFGRYATFGGSRGVEFCEPLFFKGRKGGTPGGRDPYVRDDLRLSGNEWRKYRYTYLLWGRLLYDPDAAPITWRRLLQADYGPDAEAVENGLGALSRILPLISVVHGVGGANNLYWPEIYVDLPISAWLHADHYDRRYEWDNSAPQNWGRVSPFDPVMFYTINDYAGDLISGRLAARHTPLEVAAWLDGMVAQGNAAIGALADGTAGDPAQRERTRIDMAVLACLGRFFAGKFRAAVDYALFERTRDRAAIESAVGHLELARDAFGDIVDIVDGVYQTDLVFGTELSERGHWSERLPAMDADLRVLRLERDRSEPDDSAVFAGLAGTNRAARQMPAGVAHKPDFFTRGQAHAVSLDAPDTVSCAILYYRSVDQSAGFQDVVMERQGGHFVASIPEAYTAITYPLMYYFEIRWTGDKAPLLYPGFQPALDNQPYFSVHSTDRRVGSGAQ